MGLALLDLQARAAAERAYARELLRWSENESSEGSVAVNPSMDHALMELIRMGQEEAHDRLQWANFLEDQIASRNIHLLKFLRQKKTRLEQMESSAEACVRCHHNCSRPFLGR